jgi:dienelactone hydrolase
MTGRLVNALNIYIAWACFAVPIAGLQEVSMTYEGVGITSSESKTYVMRGKSPDGDGPFPVMVYLQGTFDDFASTFDDGITDYMATKGFFAVKVDYANQDFCINVEGTGFFQTSGTCSYTLVEDNSDSLGTLSTVPQVEKARSLVGALEVLCTLAMANCTKFLAVSGHSQGPTLTILLAREEPQIRALLAMGAAGDNGLDCKGDER